MAERYIRMFYGAAEYDDVPELVRLCQRDLAGSTSVGPVENPLAPRRCCFILSEIWRIPATKSAVEMLVRLMKILYARVNYIQVDPVLCKHGPLDYCGRERMCYNNTIPTIPTADFVRAMEHVKYLRVGNCLCYIPDIVQGGHDHTTFSKWWPTVPDYEEIRGWIPLPGEFADLIFSFT
jgi:hypothetical protein